MLTTIESMCKSILSAKVIFTNSLITNYIRNSLQKITKCESYHRQVFKILTLLAV